MEYVYVYVCVCVCVCDGRSFTLIVNKTVLESRRY